MYTIDSRQINKPYPLGVTTEHGYTYFSVVIKRKTDCGIILYDLKNETETRIPFSKTNQYGSIYSMAVKDLDIGSYAYNFYEGSRIFTDPCAKIIRGHESWGESKSLLKGGFLTDHYNWEEDRPLRIPYENSILYCLNVRGFTKHKSSGIQHKGTYLGITEKAGYLSEMGITAVELMPAYEFEEAEQIVFPLGIEEAESRQPEIRYNCWGYKEGYYFAPKSAYSYHTDVVSEFKNMVKLLHQQGIEIIMQFYFPNTVSQGLILETVKYWVLEYHIDGIHLKGESIPLSIIATDPLLTDTKLFYRDFPCHTIPADSECSPFRNLASYNNDFMYTARRFLKGDEDMLGTFLALQRKKPNNHGIVNYITNYDSFSLFDMVSYEKKHNEPNGEKNKDGNDCNYTWNCGAEGISRKKAIMKLRKQQVKNACTMLFMSQGTPLLFSGDELGNTRFGNNNPYCQDNETGWVKWNMTEMGNSLLTYIKHLITLRKNHKVLHNPAELKIVDYIGCGYPDLSYHGEEAWRPELDAYSRFAGVMYCGFYAKTRDGASDNFFYTAYNMHWIAHSFALPNLPKGMKWYLIADTGQSDIMTMAPEPGEAAEEQQHVKVEARTIQIFISKQEEGQEPDKRQLYQRTAF